MTTAHFSALVGPTARAMAEVRKLHPKPPAAPVRAAIRCPRCQGRLLFTVSPAGSTTGRCSSTGCIQWRD
ncbi:hypothetical protein ACQ858_08180 [Variovorax ureilyticus]|uniref:hypothetical protein n=1 Tax=Variovorax ureilyticus TaxID=1836198 RepID=UPI003D678C8A